MTRHFDATDDICDVCGEDLGHCDCRHLIESCELVEPEHASIDRIIILAVIFLAGMAAGFIVGGMIGR